MCDCDTRRVVRKGCSVGSKYRGRDKSRLNGWKLVNCQPADDSNLALRRKRTGVGGLPSTLLAALAARAIASTSSSLTPILTRADTARIRQVLSGLLPRPTLTTTEQIAPDIPGPTVAVWLFASPPHIARKTKRERAGLLHILTEAHPYFCSSFVLIICSAPSCAASILKGFVHYSGATSTLYWGRAKQAQEAG